jgi:hypothetical protein
LIDQATVPLWAIERQQDNNEDTEAEEIRLLVRSSIIERSGFWSYDNKTTGVEALAKPPLAREAISSNQLYSTEPLWPSNAEEDYYYKEGAVDSAIVAINKQFDEQELHEEQQE